MSFAISLKAANDTAGPIRALWEEVARLEGRPSMATLDYPPHLRLAVYDDILLDHLSTVLGEVFAGTSPLPLTFTRVRFFDDAVGALGRPFAFCGARQRAREGACPHQSRAVSSALSAWGLGSPLHARYSDRARTSGRSPSVCRPSSPAISSHLRCRRLCLVPARGRYRRATASGARVANGLRAREPSRDVRVTAFTEPGDANRHHRGRFLARPMEILSNVAIASSSFPRLHWDLAT